MNVYKQQSSFITGFSTNSFSFIIFIVGLSFNIERILKTKWEQVNDPSFSFPISIPIFSKIEVLASFVVYDIVIVILQPPAKSNAIKDSYMKE